MADDKDLKVDLKIDGLSQARLIRRGDHTELYQATQRQFGRRVAVKVYTADGVRDAALARFERECRLMGELSSHPNVVTYFESGIRKRRPYVVSEWLDEGTYSAILKRGMRLDWMEAANVGIKVCGALESAHRMGLVHRKLKPEDLFVSAFGEPLIGDFQLDPSEGSRSGDMYDIMVHAAPELFRGGEATPVVDVYALASVVFTLILGRPPFLAEPDEPLVRIKGRALASRAARPARPGRAGAAVRRAVVGSSPGARRSPAERADLRPGVAGRALGRRARASADDGPADDRRRPFTPRADAPGRGGGVAADRYRLHPGAPDPGGAGARPRPAGAAPTARRGERARAPSRARARGPARTSGRRHARAARTVARTVASAASAATRTAGRHEPPAAACRCVRPTVARRARTGTARSRARARTGTHARARARVRTRTGAGGSPHTTPAGARARTGSCRSAHATRAGVPTDTGAGHAGAGAAHRRTRGRCGVGGRYRGRPGPHRHRRGRAHAVAPGAQLLHGPAGPPPHRRPRAPAGRAAAGGHRRQGQSRQEHAAQRPDR
ncbi:MAG: protein kinase [Ilumatobacteraceae bacterium]